MKRASLVKTQSGALSVKRRRCLLGKMRAGSQGKPEAELQPGKTQKNCFAS